MRSFQLRARSAERSMRPVQAAVADPTASRLPSRIHRIMAEDFSLVIAKYSTAGDICVAGED